MKAREKAMFLRRMFDGHLDGLKVPGPKWARGIDVSYGLFSDGHNCLRIKIDDVFAHGKSVLSEIKNFPNVIEFIKSKVWDEAERRAEMILFRRWEDKCGDGTKAGEIIKKALSKKKVKAPV